MVIAQIVETSRDVGAFAKGVPSLDAAIKPTERIKLLENKLLEVFPDGRTLLFDLSDKHRAALAGRRGDKDQLFTS